MNIDFEKIKNDPTNIEMEQQLRKKDPTTGFGSVLPGSIFFMIFAGPLLFLYVLSCWPILSFFQEKGLASANGTLYVFVVLSLVFGVVTEWKQPFSTTGIKQAKKGRWLRMCAGIVQLVWFGIIIFSMSLLILGYGRGQLFSGETCKAPDIFWFF